MNLAILETGKPPGDLAETYGDYPAMFRGLLGMTAPSYDVEAGEFPNDPANHDAYLLTGSPAGVYEDLPWIADLIAFLKRARGKAKLVGVCFGHQVMAEAFGGHVEKSAKGWGAGLMTYPIVAQQPWTDNVSLVSVPASHQDQVVLQPPATEVVASSLFTALRRARLDRPERHLLPVPPRIRARLRQSADRAALRPSARSRRRDRLARRANDNQRVGDWIRRFLLG